MLFNKSQERIYIFYKRDERKNTETTKAKKPLG